MQQESHEAAGLRTSAQTAISEIRNGELHYRGYRVEELVELTSFDEVAYLLLRGRLPDRREFDQHMEEVSGGRVLMPPVIEGLRRLPGGTHPMDSVVAGFATAATYDPEYGRSGREAMARKAVRIVALLPTLVVAAYRISQNREPVAPHPTLSHTANFFQMLTGLARTDFFGRVLGAMQIICAEYPASPATLAARAVASTHADIYPAVGAALAAFRGRKHGGAHETAISMLLEIGTPDAAQAWVRGQMTRKNPIPGFGPVYGSLDGDVRVKLARDFVLQVVERTRERRLVDVLQSLELAMASETNTTPNVALYSAAAWYLMKLPIQLYTPIAAMAGVAGWCAHVLEQLDAGEIVTSAAEYVGESARAVLALDER
jgi:citrate synthase